jgi:hypothetical protein
VVTNKQRFEFIQTEAVSERVLPVTLLLSIRDGDRSVSDEQILTFDSTSPMLDERKRSVMLTLAAGNYDRTKDYFLVARDAKTKAEAWRAPLRIDLAFSNDSRESTGHGKHHGDREGEIRRAFSTGHWSSGSGNARDVRGISQGGWTGHPRDFSFSMTFTEADGLMIAGSSLRVAVGSPANAASDARRATPSRSTGASRLYPKISELTRAAQSICAD